jgi:transposase InsO family protein
MGIRDKPTAPASPWQNGYAERLIGSIRRECIKTTSGHTDHWIKMRRLLGRFSEPVPFVHAPFWADFITNMFVFRFAVDTALDVKTATMPRRRLRNNDQQ